MSYRIWERVLGADTRNRRRGDTAHIPDFRTKDQVAADLTLVGTWWRCRVHGLLEDAVCLGGAPFCPDADCNLQVLVVCSGRLAHEVETTQATWGWSPHQRRNGKVPVAHESASSRAGHCTACNRVIPPQVPHVVCEGAHGLRVAWCVPCGRQSDRADVRGVAGSMES
jgi:hypothetical protein